MQPGGPANAITLFAEPLPKQPVFLDFVTVEAQLFVDGLPAQQPPQFFSDLVEPERGRIQVQFVEPLPIPDHLPLDLVLQMQIQPGPGQGLAIELQRFGQIEGAPTGFENVAPVGEGLIGVGPEKNFFIESFFDVTYQLQLIGIDQNGDRRRVNFPQIQMLPLPNGFEVQLTGGLVEPGASPQLLALELSQDFRGFASEIPQGQLGMIFVDGFESGNVSRWSSSTP